MVVPTPKSPQTVPISCSPNLKPPIAHLNAKYLIFLSKTLTFSGDLAVQYMCVYFASNMHPLWQGKGAFLKLPRSTFASGFRHYKCCITMLQGRVWGRDTGKAGKWEALTQGTQGKKAEKTVSPHLLRVSARFLLSEFGSKY